MGKRCVVHEEVPTCSHTLEFLDQKINDRLRDLLFEREIDW